MKRNKMLKQKQIDKLNVPFQKKKVEICYLFLKSHDNKLTLYIGL